MRLVTLKEACKILEVPMSMLEKMEQTGMIKMRRTQNGVRRFDLDSLPGSLKKLVNPERLPENKKVNGLVKPKEAAIALGVTDRTLRNWEAAGKIQSTKTSNGRKFYDLDSVVYEG
ncbi:MerR family DNA-binding transcriptional regulator [Moorena producens JHB]|uniref:MerR family DNA-binding transcriptional regulator n=1 Tax=Moorena producens (strain JHB) TaxID=1454205 RepID=A0A1D9FZ24_MOOP1|nr:MerR family DNA-binding transcriptional regulator [Moorena producens]AOY80583.1 MerR family DNA-binding transcriptional regulator [Moorena producens JHB]